MRLPTTIAIIAFALVQAAGGAVLISEIMYNPNSSEPAAEWVEIFNNGPSTANISGYYLGDEDGATSVIPGGTFIAPGEAVVLIPGSVTVAEFTAAWGSGFQVFSLGGWEFADASGKFGGTMSNLGNSPSATDEILQLFDASDAPVDLVNYDDSGSWPADGNSYSIYLTNTMLDNNDGANWGISIVGVDGAFNNTITGTYGGVDVGSPGFAILAPEPSQGILLLLGGLGIVLRRSKRRKR